MDIRDNKVNKDNDGSHTVVELLPFLPLLATGGGGNCPCPTKIGPAGCTWVKGTLIYCLATFSIFYWPFF